MLLLMSYEYKVLPQNESFSRTTLRELSYYAQTERLNIQSRIVISA